MKNILLAINSAKLEMNAGDFACYIAELTHSKLTGIFLENVPESEIPELKNIFGNPYVETIVAEDIPGNKKKRESAEVNIRNFNEACMNSVG